MSTLPIIIAIAAAATVAVLVLVAVFVSRRRKAEASDDGPGESFLGSRPQDTFAGLGEPETAAGTDDEFRLDWGHTGEDVAVADAPAAANGAATTAPEEAPTGLGETEPPAEHDGEPSTAEGQEEPARLIEDEAAAEHEAPGEDDGKPSTAGEHEEPAGGGGPAAAAADEAAAEATEETTDATEGAAAVEADDVKGAQADVHEAGTEAEAATEARTAVDEAGAETEDLTEATIGEREIVAEAELTTEAPEAAPGPGPAEPPAPRMVPLSRIIVTTSRKMVDLDDPEVRRMLTELVRYEIDQASEFSAAGQTVDAILQLTEAEKISRTLGMDETAARIKTMMCELQD